MTKKAVVSQLREHDKYDRLIWRRLEDFNRFPPRWRIPAMRVRCAGPSMRPREA